MPAPKRGRPPLTPGDPPARVQLLLAPDQYDKLWRLARREDVSVPELLRRGAQRVLADDDEDA